jgi:hypothetical protein
MHVLSLNCWVECDHWGYISASSQRVRDMANNLAHYKVYVIRCWQEQNSSASTTISRFTLELPGSGQRFGFTSSKALIDEVGRRLAENLAEESDELFDESFVEE